MGRERESESVTHVTSFLIIITIKCEQNDPRFGNLRN